MQEMLSPLVIMERKHILNISGGKDSTAMYLHALEQGTEFRAVFADTGNEHELTYEFLRCLPEKTGGPAIEWICPDFSKLIAGKRRFLAELSGDSWPRVERLRALAHLQPTGIPFLDLCLAKGRFPSVKARFCTEQLKVLAIYDYALEPLLEQGFEVYSWQGIRADESRRRALLPYVERDTKAAHLFNFRPLLFWSADQVFEMHRRHGLEPNPLYKMGMARVGCLPCINSTKDEICNIARRFPAHIARIAEWEQQVAQVSRNGQASFFSHDKIPGAHQLDHSVPIPGIREVVKWSQTSRGGRQYSLWKALPNQGCASVYGLCE